MKLLYLDTNIFLNVLLEEEGFVISSLNLLESIEEKRYQGVTSFLTLMEIHRILQKQNKNEAEIQKAIQKISNSAIEIYLPDGTDLLRAYELLRELKIDPADSLHLTVAQEKGAIFVTRDEDLTKKIKQIIKTSIPERLI